MSVKHTFITIWASFTKSLFICNEGCKVTQNVTCHQFYLSHSTVTFVMCMFIQPWNTFCSLLSSSGHAHTRFVCIIIQSSFDLFCYHAICHTVIVIWQISPSWPTYLFKTNPKWNISMPLHLLARGTGRPKWVSIRFKFDLKPEQKQKKTLYFTNCLPWWWDKSGIQIYWLNKLSNPGCSLKSYDLWAPSCSQLAGVLAAGCPSCTALTLRSNRHAPLNISHHCSGDELLWRHNLLWQDILQNVHLYWIINKNTTPWHHSRGVCVLLVKHCKNVFT